MPEFCSFLVFRLDEIKLIHSICASANWSTRDISDPSMRYQFSGMGMSEIAQVSALKDLGGLREGEQRGRLLIFETEQSEVDNIIKLICAANLILEGFPDRGSPPNSGFPLSEDAAERERTFEHVFRSDGFFEWFTYRESLPVAVAIAAEAWRDKRLLYAIHKLAHSYKTESVTHWSMHPRFEQVFLKHSADFSLHVRTSVAINLAYSAIQELDLDVKASPEKPRSIGQGTFVWNPEVLSSFKERLRKADIDPEIIVDWIIRGEQTEVDIYKMLDNSSAHSNGVDIRDRQVSLPDAINFCEFLRNTMTAHAFSTDTPRLGPYEVYNTQQVARLLILSKCKLWNTRIEDLRKRYG